MSYNPTSRTIVDNGSTAVNDGDSIHDVQVALGDTSENRLGYLCNYSTVNPWAKYKPVIYLDDAGKPVLNTVNSDQANQDSNGNWTWKTEAEYGSTVRPWWRGYIPESVSAWANYLNGGIYDCGFRIPKYSTSTALANAFIQGTQNVSWTYAPPNVNHGFRLADFLGYRNNATSAIGSFGGKNLFSTSEDIVLSINNRIRTGNTEDGCLTLGDFRVLRGYYFGVVIWPKSATSATTSNCSTVTSTGTVGSTQNCSVSFRMSGAGNFLAVPFLASSSGTVGNTEYTDIYPITVSAPHEFEVTTGSAVAWILIDAVNWTKTTSNGNTYINLDITYKTLREQNSGNYNNAQDVAIYSIDITTYDVSNGFVINPAHADTGNGSETMSYQETYTPNGTDSSNTLYNSNPDTVPCCAPGQASSTATKQHRCQIGSTWSKTKVSITCTVCMTVDTSNNSTAWKTGTQTSYTYVLPELNTESSSSGTSSSLDGIVQITDGSFSDDGSGPDIDPPSVDTGQNGNP